MCKREKKKVQFSLLRSMLCSITADPSMEIMQRVMGKWLVALLSSGGQGRHKAGEYLHVKRRGHGERCRGLNQLEDCRFYWSQMFVAWNT